MTESTIIPTEPKVQNLNSILDDGFDVIEDTPEQSTGTVLAANELQEKNDNQAPSSSLFEGPIVERELPGFNAQFEIQADRAQVLGEVLKIQNDIQNRGTISTEDIAQIDAVLPGFVSDERPIEQYTQEPSKVNLDQGLNDVDTVLEKNYDDLRTSTASVAEQYLKLNNGLPELINKKFYQTLSALNQSYAEFLALTQKDDISQVSYILNNGMRLSKFFNSPAVTSDPVCSTSGDADPFANTFVDPFIKAIAKIDEGSKSLSTLAFYKTTANRYLFTSRKVYLVDQGQVTETTEDAANKECNTYGFYGTLSYGELYSFVLGSSCRELISTIIKTISRNLDSISICATKAKEVQEENIHLVDKISNLARLSTTINDCTRNNFVFILFLESLFGFANVFIELIKELTAKQTPVVTEV